jgi:hypothetical protein
MEGVLSSWCDYIPMTKHTHIVVALVSGLLAVSTFASLDARPRRLTMTLVYTTAETSTSAAVVWNTNVASDSLVQYSTTNPIPPSAPTLYSASLVTYHEFDLTGLSPGTLYYFRVTSCAKRECVTATGSFDTYPSCPDVVPPVSGSWTKDISPNVSGTTWLENHLFGIAAVSDNDVWAVGWSQEPESPPYVRRPLIEHFDGNGWSIVPSPFRPDDYYTVLSAVSAASADDAWAVGTTHDGTLPSRTFIQHWDSTQWRIVPSPSPDSQLNELLGVTAVSANDVWAVGFRGGTRDDTPLEPLILHWDGLNWSQVASPSVIGAPNQLSAVAAISADDIWAVGTAGGAPLSMRWNGSAWSIVPVRPNAGLRTENLTAVSGTASNDVWTVGTGKGFFSNFSAATIRHWDGVRWTEKVCRASSSSNPSADYEGGGPDAYFTGVSAAASHDVWAVGVVGSGPYIMHWDGLAWTQVTHPRAFPNSAVLRGVTTLAGGRAWSAGTEYELTSGGQLTQVRTLVDRYTP